MDAPKEIEDKMSETESKALDALAKLIVQCTVMGVKTEHILLFVDVSKAYISKPPISNRMRYMSSRNESAVEWFITFLQRVMGQYSIDDNLHPDIFVKWLTKNIQYLSSSGNVCLFLEPEVSMEAVFSFWQLMAHPRFADEIDYLRVFKGESIRAINLDKFVDLVRSVRLKLTDRAGDCKELFPMKLALMPNPLWRKIIYIQEPDEWFDLDLTHIYVHTKLYPLSIHLETPDVDYLSLEVWCGTINNDDRRRILDELNDKGIDYAKHGFHPVL
jgi:hypothetical protein